MSFLARYLWLAPRALPTRSAFLAEGICTRDSFHMLSQPVPAPSRVM